MKKIILMMFLFTLIMVACKDGGPKENELSNEGQNLNIKTNVEKEVDKEVDKSLEEEKPLIFSNMADETSKKEVEDALKETLKKESVDNFMALVDDYNKTIENTSLTSGFEKMDQVKYDFVKIFELWEEKKGEFPGTNCRINTFMLLKDDIEINKSPYDDSLLFIDLDAIDIEKIFTGDDLEKFKILFSKVKAKDTKDVKIQAEEMKAHLSKIKFSDKARMISLIVNDNYDDNCLYIGHTGVLVEDGKGGYFFIEKLNFSDPYQAVKFESKDDLYKYLMDKYSSYTTDETANPFIMENDELVYQEDN